ncbi:MAG: hypothetical protein H7Y15_17325 [Pseudonocardia sp.]|nr:hypothetical protein [Pseudonocardia sp.]
MAPRPDRLRFFVDESALGLGLLLARARRDVVHTGHPLIPEVPPRARDEDWFPVVAARGLVAIARDKRFRSRSPEVMAMRAAKLRVVYLTGMGNASVWDQLVRVVTQWERIEERVARGDRGPWFASVHARGVTDLRVTDE